jgi:hypothetical protein
MSFGSSPLLYPVPRLQLLIGMWFVCSWCSDPACWFAISARNYLCLCYFDSMFYRDWSWSFIFLDHFWSRTCKIFSSIGMWNLINWLLICVLIILFIRTIVEGDLQSLWSLLYLVQEFWKILSIGMFMRLMDFLFWYWCMIVACDYI